MMNFDIITVQPDLLNGPLNHSILKRAKEKKLVNFNVINLRDYAINKHGQVDDYQYGGGAGMVLMCEPLANALDDLLNKNTYDDVIYTSPDGETLNQKMANQMSLKNNFIIICGHYKGIDERIRELYVTKEISIGDYVLTGGELAAAVIADSVSRLIPGVLGNEESALSDSFQDDLLAPPVYTRPASFKGLDVPEVLLTGHFKNIEDWRLEKAMEKTKLKRPDLLK
jgi:tRNA (guanine37-N1)-methyltransferase